MAVTVTNYGLLSQSLIEGRINLSADEVWCMLVTSAYTLNQNTHKYKNAVTGEVIGSGYSAGGKKVTVSASSYDSLTKTLKVPAGNLSWPSVTFTGVTGAIVYVKRIGAAENAMPLISHINFGESISRTAQAFYINWPETGICKLAVP